MLTQFEWIVATGAIFAFFTSFGIGANDVATAGTNAGAAYIYGGYSYYM
jgi:phosphate/sulfate permease|tara:strand:+ start:4070 stop:4216 length:147 start_codon:yes stop_codon:yes gene_type:complete